MLAGDFLAEKGTGNEIENCRGTSDFVNRPELVWVVIRVTAWWCRNQLWTGQQSFQKPTRYPRGFRITEFEFFAPGICPGLGIRDQWEPGRVKVCVKSRAGLFRVCRPIGPGTRKSVARRQRPASYKTGPPRVRTESVGGSPFFARDRPCRGRAGFNWRSDCWRSW